MIFAPKLKKGDEVRVVAPARSFRTTFPDERRKLAIKRLNNLGLKVSFGKYVDELNEFGSTTIEHRLEDLHDAFADKNVKAILSVLGGTQSNQLLKYLDYDLIKNNPKILCGLSDITSLANAINTKTGLVTYSGPHFSLFGAELQTDYTIDYFVKCCFKDDTININPAERYCNHRWDTEDFINEGFWNLNNGVAEGRIVGGNLVTLNLLQGSKYMPDLTGAIVFAEDNDKESIRAFENHLQSLIHQPNFSKVKGLVIGRFQSGTEMTRDLLTKIIKTKKELDHIPIIGNVDFGHTTPMITIPIGGEIKLDVNDNERNIEIIKH